MNKKQKIFILLVCASLVITLLLGSVVYYFVGHSDVGGVQATGGSEADFSELPTAVQAIALHHTGEQSDRELRGVWISSVFNIDFPSKAGLDADTLKSELDRIVENAKEARLNTIFFQVRPSADALYDSDFFPVSAYLAGSQGADLPDGFDPLEYIVKKAHENGIELHAWINPFRITCGSKSTLQSDIASLSSDSPAVLHRDWTVEYEDGKLYFDPGIPQVRELIISGALEIVKNYDVDGIHLDDYFYPYPVYTTDSTGRHIADFDDSASYSAYANGADKEYWRRDNINTLIRDMKNAIKAERADCDFGVACAGIWANASSLEGGSDTNGMQSYFDTYSDSKYWIENGFVDYICPQIYWEMSHKSAPFDVLCKWWSSVVDGTGVKLYIGHALYKNEDWSDKTEIARQIEFARSWMGYKGSVFFGYDQIAGNKDGMKDRIAHVFYEDYYHPDLPSTGEEVTFGSPQPSTVVKAGNSYILGKSDPGYPLYYNGKKLPRTQHGYFNMYVTLNSGQNNFEFTQNGKKTVITLSTVYPNAQGGGDDGLGKMIIKSVSPSNDIITAPGSEIALSCTAPAGSSVTVQLGSQSVTLSPQGNVASSPKYLPQTYKGSLKLPSQADGLVDLGQLQFKAVLSGETAEQTAANIKIMPDGCKAFIEVKNDYSHLKISPTSSFYDDYLPSSIGMRDYVVSLADGYYKLRFGGYIAQENAEFVEGELLDGKLLSAEMLTDERYTTLKLDVAENLPMTAYCEDGTVTVKLFNVSGGFDASPEKQDNPLFSDVSFTSDSGNNTATYKLRLKDADNYYGFNVEYRDGSILINFKNPTKLDLDKDTPLEGLTIIVDAGHGGSDTGALGFVSQGDNALNEEQLNLLTAQALQKYLTAYGAQVIMTRNEDITVSLEERMKFLNDTPCDLAISVHHNSLDYVTNVTRVRGLVGLWWNDSGRLLAKKLSAAATYGLSRYERTPSPQMLAVCRNHKFPSALIEMAFVTSAEEYENITQPENIDLAGRSLAQGVIDYYMAQQQYL